MVAGNLASSDTRKKVPGYRIFSLQSLTEITEQKKFQKILLKQRKMLFDEIPSFNIARTWAKDEKLSWWSFKS